MDNGFQVRGKPRGMRPPLGVQNLSSGLIAALGLAAQFSKYFHIFIRLHFFAFLGLEPD
jgi:hypothetical protein